MSTEITPSSTSGSDTNVYRTLITPRSRRLRTTGTILLVAVLIMTAYGILVLMPSLHTITRSASPGIVSSSRGSNDIEYKAESKIVESKIVESKEFDSKSEAKMGVAKIASHASGTVIASDRVRSDGLTEREHKVILTKVLFSYGYWAVCVALLMALMVVCWLDFRELARNYDNERHRIYLQSLADGVGTE